MKFLMTPVTINITPQLIDDLSRFYEFMQNFSISLDLKQYRPQRRPICLSDLNVQDIQEDHIKRKRRLIVRDWFFFVVWYVRLRKLLVNFYSEQLIEKEIEENKDKYEGLIKAAENGKDNIRQYLEDQNKLNKEKSTQQTSQEPQRKWDDIQTLFKFQEVNLKIYEDFDKFQTKDKQKLPSFDINLDTLVYESTINHLASQEQKSFVFKDMKLYHTQIYKKDLNLPKVTTLQNPSDNMKCLSDRDALQKNNPTMKRDLTQNQVSMNATSFFNTTQNVSNRNAPSNYARKYMRNSDYNEEETPVSSFQTKNLTLQSNSQMSQNYSQRVLGQSHNPLMDNQQKMQQQPSANNQKQQQQQNSVFDIFGLKSTFETFFANLTTTNTTSQNQVQQHQQVQMQSSITINQFERKQQVNEYQPSITQTSNISTVLGGYEQNKLLSNKTNLRNRHLMGTTNTQSRRGFVSDHDLNEILNMAPTTSQTGAQGRKTPASFNNTGSSIPQRAKQASQTSSLINSQPKWQTQDYEHATHSSLCIQRVQIAHVYSTQNNQPSFMLTKSSVLPQQDQHTLIAHKNQSMDIDTQVGNIDVQYCNEIIKTMCETIVAYKKLHVFRYVPLKNLIQKRENIHRKIELHAPLYLIKQLFISSGNVRKSTVFDSLTNKPLQSDTATLQKQPPLKNKKASTSHTPKLQFKKNNKFNCDDSSEEDENISDNEDQEHKNARKNIQQAVSSKNSETCYNWKNNNYFKDKGLQDQAAKCLNVQTNSDNYILKKIIDFEQSYTKVDIKAKVLLNHFDLVAIQPRETLNEQSQVLCKLKINQNTLSMYKNKEESGFDAFGIQFQTLNKFEMYYLFIKNLVKGVENYTQHPVFNLSSSTHFDQLRQVFRDNYRLRQLSDKDKAQNQFGQLENGSLLQMIQSKASPKNLIYNAEGVRQQEEILYKGLTQTKGTKKQSHYDILFNNLKDNSSSQSHTPTLSYKNLTLNEQNKNEYQDIRQNKHHQQEVTSHQVYVHDTEEALDDDSKVNLQVFSTEEHEKEEEKEINNLINGELFGQSENLTPHTNKQRKGSGLVNQSSPKSFLQQTRHKQLIHEGISPKNNQQMKPQPHIKPQAHKKQTSTTKLPLNDHHLAQSKTPKHYQQALHTSKNTEVNKSLTLKRNAASNAATQRNRSQQIEDTINHSITQHHQQPKKEEKLSFSKFVDASKSKHQYHKQMSSGLGSSCEEEMVEKDDEEGFAMLLGKQMNTTALKKTKSNNHPGQQQRNHLTFGIKNAKF